MEIVLQYQIAKTKQSFICTAFYCVQEQGMFHM